MKLILSFSFIIVVGGSSICQTISENEIYNTPIGENYARIAYDNDLFVGSDNNYTQGSVIDFSVDWLRHNPFNYLLPYRKNNETQYALSIRHHVYTPTDLGATAIQINERPYAAVMSLKSINFHINPEKTRLISSNIEIGVIGEASKGEGIQTYIHEQTNGTIPLGWDNQIKNEFILNYGYSVTQRLLDSKVLSVNGIGEANLGNLYTNLNLGLNINLGFQNNTFENKITDKKFETYLFYHPTVSFVGYNATLQGSIFNNKSPHTIPNSDINRLLLKQKFGIYTRFNKLFSEFSIGLSTKEINTSSSYLWGGLKMGYIF